MSYWDTRLINAARFGNIDDVRQAIRAGADIHAEEDRAALFAAAYGHLDILEFLHENGADIHVKDDFPLRFAVDEGHLDIVVWLHEHGADIRACDDLPMIWAAHYDHMHIVSYLMDNGVPLSVLGPDEQDRIAPALAQWRSENPNALRNTFNDTTTKPEDMLEKIRKDAPQRPRLPKPPSQ